MGTITVWDTLKSKFVNKFFPPLRTTKKVEEINNFKQDQHETLYKAWERFKDMIVRCPQHYLRKLQILVAFYKGLDISIRQMLNSQGPIPKMIAEKAEKAIQEKAYHSHKWHDGELYRDESNEDLSILSSITDQIVSLKEELMKLTDTGDEKLVGNALYGNFLEKHYPGQDYTRNKLLDTLL